ncbi:30S ribosomal protein S19 [Methanolobus sp.]|jgi:small subunit ribosomal protein S19|uniref:30S ribosomal protein S19 n=1 Tax=Methanolobus sp. TaxID=1874737 RepID=UPI0025F635AF|nr:30S ribosomal protein S19 [Methanolobus sp.]
MAKKTSSRLPKRKGEYTYRGKTVAELQAIGNDGFVEMLPARERRTLKRGYTEGRKNVVQQLRDGRDNLRTHYRDIIIFPEMVGKNVEVYNGKSFVAFEIQPEMIGHRFGEFSPTRPKVSHGSAGVGATRSSKFVPLK